MDEMEKSGKYMDTKSVSILLSCFNGSELIKPYVDSLLQHKIVAHCRLVVVDFPFSHSDPEAVTNQIRRYPDLVYLPQATNISLYDSWNLAIEHTNTEFVSNLNLDDRVSHDYFEVGVLELQKLGADVFSTYAMMTSKIGELTADSREQRHIERIKENEDEIISYGLSDLVVKKGNRLVKFNVPHCAPIWRRSLHNELGWFDSKRYDFCADFEFWMRVAAAQKKMILSPTFRTIFFAGTGTVSDRLMHESSEAILLKWDSTFPPAGYQETHLGRRHDRLHHCMNLNAIFARSSYTSHLRSDSFPLIEQYSRIAAMPDEGLSFRRLERFKDIHKGQKGLLLCNGPSLNEVQFDRVAHEQFTFFGLNKIYLGFERLGITVSYIAAVNQKVIEQAADVYNDLDIVKFVSTRSDPRLVPEGEMCFRINTNLPKKHSRFSEDIIEYVHEGWTVTHAALQIMYYMGFSEIYIVGMDHRFSQHIPGKENEEAKIQGEDKDHFDPNYFGNGQTWDFPDLRNSEISYRSALEVFRRDGREIFDCTIGGGCRVFPKLDIEEIYSKNVRNPVDDAIVSVSIIMPLYNAGGYLREAIMSVLSQRSSLELVIVDDGSTDGSFLLAAELATCDNRIRIVRNKSNKGVSGARNTGLQLARGEFVAFLDADDSYEPGAIDERLGMARSRQAMLLHSGVRFINSAGIGLGIELVHRSSLSFADMNSNKAHLNSLLIKRSLIENIRFDESLENGEDWKFLAQILRTGVTSNYVDNGWATYRIHGDSSVVGDYEKHEVGVSKVVNWIFDDMTSNPEYRPDLKANGSLEEVLKGRELNKFLWAVLTENLVFAIAMLKDEKKGRFLRNVSKARTLGSLKVAIARRFFSDAKQLACDSEACTRIGATLSKISAQEKCPGVYGAFDELLDLSKDETKVAGDGSAVLIGPFERDDHAHLDETDCVAWIFQGGEPGLMIDVGAHYGTALAPFLRMDWKILAFEPDPDNRAKLLSYLEAHDEKGAVYVDQRCVGDHPAKNVPFFGSDQSSGISGLSHFHDSHEQKQTVDITTLADFLENRPEVRQVDFLKVDTEGHDLFVLMGFPWDRLRPKVIECEFEDNKTLSLGYSFHELCQFLTDKGYCVFVSEWHPIVRYGIRHDWKMLKRYPCALDDNNSWGNILAFDYEVVQESVESAFRALLKINAGGTPVSTLSNQIYPEPSRLNESSSHVYALSEPVYVALKVGTSEQTKFLVLGDLAADIGSEFVAALKVSVNQPSKLKISLARHGTEAYEARASIQTLDSSPLECRLTHTFARAHSGLRIQIELIESQDESEVVVAIHSLVAFESIDSFEKRGGELPSFKEANEALRVSNFALAYVLYNRLYRRNKLDIYLDGIRRAKSSLGFEAANLI
ncbi:MAG: FkbM family methyltransferase [Pseudomonadota bacterium]